MDVEFRCMRCGEKFAIELDISDNIPDCLFCGACLDRADEKIIENEGLLPDEDLEDVYANAGVTLPDGSVSEPVNNNEEPPDEDA